MTSRRLVTLLVALAALLSACAGPRRPLEVGVREFPTNVLFGSKDTPPPPPPGSNPNPGFPVLVQPPPAVGPTGPIPRPLPSPSEACPEAHPFAAPRYIAGNRSTSAPIPASYRFRNDGSFENVEGGQTTMGTFPPATVRTIGDVEAASDGSHTFSISEDLGDRVTTTRYEVVPDSPLAEAAGVFITQIATEFGSGTGSEAFTPQPALKILQFPAENGAQWDSVGTDPLRQTTMSFHARIGREAPDGPDEGEAPDLIPKIKVNACGRVLDAWYVDVTGGQVLGPQTSLTFRSFYAIATQFGGFPVMERIELSGNDRGVQTDSRNTATISEEPAFPG